MQHTPTQGKRWLVASMGTLLQLCLGTVYAWSYFQKPIMERFGWSNSQTAWTFSIAIAALGLAAAWGGMNLAKYGPRRLTRIGSILFSAGYLLGTLAFALKSLALLYLGYGIIGGIGLGLSYVTPVATVAKWFPDKKGLVTGMVIMGFGFGALFMSKVVAPVFMALAGALGRGGASGGGRAVMGMAGGGHGRGGASGGELIARAVVGMGGGELARGGDLVFVFLGIGVLMAVLTFPAASFLRNPGEGVREGAGPQGAARSGRVAAKGAARAAPTAGRGNDAAQEGKGAPEGRSALEGQRAAPAQVSSGEIRGAIFSARFGILWLVFFLNITAGIMFICFQSPMIQDMVHAQSPGKSAAELAGIGALLMALGFGLSFLLSDGERFKKGV